MDNFKQLNKVGNVQRVIKDIFDVELDISGDWGYDEKHPLVINKLDMPVDQFLHMYATMRANMEMNLTLHNDDDRYGAINATYLDNKIIQLDNKIYNQVTFKVTAIKEKLYASFIKEYKDGYGKKEFDLAKHFKNREENTISRDVEYWFLGLEQ